MATVEWKSLIKNKLKVVGAYRERIPKPSVDFGSNSEVHEKDRPFSLDDLKRNSENNLNAAVELLDYRVKWAHQNAPKNSDYVDDGQLSRVIIDPNSPASVEDFDPQDEEEVYESLQSGSYEIHDRVKGLDDYIHDIDKKRFAEIKKSELLTKQQDAVFKGKYQNYHFLTDINDGAVFESNLKKAGIRCALLLTDTFYTRDTEFYKRIIKIFKKNSISFVEYTNLQPNLDRKLIFRIHEFANDHDVNSIVAIGSMSTIDLSKILMPKLMKPNIVRLHKNREISPLLASQYSVFSIPTFVVPEDGVNSRSAVHNSLLLANNNLFGNVLFLKNEIDDADAVFYCQDVFDILSKEKMMDVLHETFFRLFFCYFDVAANEELLKLIIKNLKIVEGMIEMLSIGNEISVKDKQALMQIISFTMDGRTIVDTPEYWTIYKLEGALSLLTNSKKSDGLALFFPIFLEVMSNNSFEFKQRAIDLGSNLWGVFSVEGCVYRLSMHIKQYGLPSALIDIPQIKKPDYKFLASLLRKAQISSSFSPLSKAIIKNLNVL